MKSAFLIVLFIGLIIRIFLIGNPGFEADVSFWKSWGLAALDHGIVWTSLNTNINYPPGFIYILWLMAKIYSLFADPRDFNTFWQVNNYIFLFASKSIAIAADMAIAGLIYWFFSQKKKLHVLGIDTNKYSKNLPLILASIFYLHPVVLIDSALWGQVESLGLFFTLAAVVLLFYKKPLLATAVFAIGPMLKLQNIIFIPIFFLFLLRYFDLKTTVKSIAVFITVFIAIILPFIFQKETDQVLYLLTVNSDYFPWLSLNAHNLWWIVAGGRGMEITDKVTTLGILNAKSVGLLLFSSSYLLACLLTFLKPTPRNFCLSLTFAIFSFFLLMTESHERYSYPVVVLLLFLYPFIQNSIPIKSGHISKIYFWIIYFLFSINIFFNIHTGLILNYPNNGIHWLASITSPALTIANSYFSILLYLLLFPFIFSQINILFLASCIIIFLSLIALSHASYLIKGKVSLTSFKPIIIKQDFGELQINRSVNSGEGWKKWTRLSNNYFYYRKGFGTHANSNIVFEIDRKFSSFSTDMGIDTEAPSAATVVFQIWGDNKLLFESPKLGRFDFPLHTKVDVKGIKYLGLTVTDAGDGINSDHADWLNPILYK